jgi:glycosyltransferase involved in cell wall biosynthesis
MSETPFFSVVIPTYNRAGFIKKTIESVLAQSFQDFEIIVVDDGSTDNTESIVSGIVNRKIHYLKKNNAERAAARNFGATKARGEYINFLDSDDVLYTNHLQVASEFCRTHQGVEIFHLGYDMKDESGKILKQVDNIKSINDQIVNGNLLSCNGVFVRKEEILKNPFNEDRSLSSLEDWELWIRMSSRNTFKHANVITSTVIQHEERSVMTPDVQKIIQKVERFVSFILQDEANKKYFGKKINKATASAWTYAALHLAIANHNKKQVLSYLWKGLTTYPGEVFKKRFLVILKKVVGL